MYTKWYRNQGYDFTITSSTAFDHKWIHNRNIFENISLIVDELFADYLSRPNVKQPILTQYCDGKRVSCPSWMSQWGSQSLGEQGYTAIEILRNYYGESMYINTAEEISGVPYSWPGYELKNGASGQKVLQLQEQLTGQIADALMEHMQAKGAIVMIEAEHMCMTMRGIKKPGSQTVTLARRGVFETDPALEERFFRMLER